MKILYAVVECNTGNHQNAKERYVYSLALEAKSRGHKVGVICPSSSPLFTYLTKTADTGIAVYPINVSGGATDVLTGSWQNIKKFFILYGILRRAKPNIVHFNCPRFGALGGIVSKIARVPKTIYTYHEWPTNKKGSWPIARKFAAKIISHIAIIANHKIITLSKKEEKKIDKWLGAKGKVTTIQNGIKPFKSLDKDKALIALLGFERAAEMMKQNKRILGSISSLTQNKGYTYALQGLAQYKKFVEGDAANGAGGGFGGANNTIGTRGGFNYHYIIVGEGPDLHALQHVVENLGLDEHVTFVGFIREAKEYIQAFDFLFSNIISDSTTHSTNNAYPQIILEAGLKKVPVIATETGAIGEIIENLETGFLIPPARPTEIKHILHYIDEHSGLERTCAANLFKKIENGLMFEKQADKTFALY